MEWIVFSFGYPASLCSTGRTDVCKRRRGSWRSALVPAAQCVAADSPQGAGTGTRTGSGQPCRHMLTAPRERCYILYLILTRYPSPDLYLPCGRLGEQGGEWCLAGEARPGVNVDVGPGVNSAQLRREVTTAALASACMAIIVCEMKIF